MDSSLDNPVWSALTGPHADIALGRGQARHYPRDMAPFSAIAASTADAYADLGADLPPGLEARLFRPRDETPPAGWEVVSARPIEQMVAAESPAAVTDARPEVLGDGDVDAIMELVAAAKPGPFDRRSVRLGRFLGIRDRGMLVAMAGERFRLAGHVELSAIATHPSVRGRGFAALLIRALMRDAFARGEVPFLHVFPENPAIGLYERLGFRRRSRLWVLWHRRTAA
jgi:ribosomal protein S18 acetylase RimI-like enzyme